MIGQNDEFALLYATAQTMGATGDKANAVAYMQCEVVWAVVIPEGADANAIGGVVKFDLRPLAGSDVGRTDGTLGVINKTASVNQQGIPLVWYAKPGSVIIKPGQQVVMEVTTANGAALSFTGALVCRHSPESWQNLAKQGKAKIMP